MKKVRPLLIYNRGTFHIKSGVILLICACFNPEIDMKATKMAFVVFASGGIFSKVVFMLVPKDTYHPIPFVSQLLFVMLSDISHHLCLHPRKIQRDPAAVNCQSFGTNWIKVW